MHFAGNYGAGLKALAAAKKDGFTDVVYLDAKTDAYLEELSAANIFVVKVRPVLHMNPLLQVIPMTEFYQFALGEECRSVTPHV